MSHAESHPPVTEDQGLPSVGVVHTLGRLRGVCPTRAALWESGRAGTAWGGGQTVGPRGVITGPAKEPREEDYRGPHRFGGPTLFLTQAPIVLGVQPYFDTGPCEGYFEKNEIQSGVLLVSMWLA